MPETPAAERSRKLYEIPIQENGRMILPMELRKSLGLEKGDRVLIEAEGETITLTTARQRRKKAQEIAARYATPGEAVVDDFLSEKRKDAARKIDAIQAASSDDTP